MHDIYIHKYTNVLMQNLEQERQICDKHEMYTLLYTLLYLLNYISLGGGWGWWGGGQGGCERNVGGRGDVGYGGCEPRIEGIVQCTKRYCTILRK